MFSRKRGTWVNFNDAPRGSTSIAKMRPGCLSTSAEVRSDRHPVVTNGKIVSVSDKITMTPQNSQVARVHDRA
jgi:hypothetical protein